MGGYPFVPFSFSTSSSSSTPISGGGDEFFSLREHDRYGGSFTADVTYSGNIAMTSTSSALGFGYVFFSLQREALRDRKLEIDWTLTTTDNVLDAFHVNLFEGALDRTSSTDFPNGSDINATEATNSPLISRMVGGNYVDTLEFTDTMLNSLTNGPVTVVVALEDRWNGETFTLQINSLKLLNLSDVVVADYDIANRTINMEQTGTENDYGTFN